MCFKQLRDRFVSGFENSWFAYDDEENNKPTANIIPAPIPVPLHRCDALDN